MITKPGSRRQDPATRQTKSLVSADCDDKVPRVISGLDCVNETFVLLRC